MAAETSPDEATSLTSRITVGGTVEDEPEDLFATSLGVIFPDDVTIQHGDADHPLIYASPHLPRPLRFDLSDPNGENDRLLYSHYLWNASLLLAELIERDTLGLARPAGGAAAPASAAADFSVRGLSVVEVGAGTALPAIMAALLGASRVLVTDYPSPPVLEVLRANVVRNTAPELAPAGSSAAPDVSVQGHEWGVIDGDDAMAPHRGAYDRVLSCDCLWMPGQHENLRRSLGYLLAPGAESRAWVVAGFHTGRAKMAGFFDAEALRRDAGLEVETIWERECNGTERAWDASAEEEDRTWRKRWLVVGVLRRVRD